MNQKFYLNFLVILIICGGILASKRAGRFLLDAEGIQQTGMTYKRLGVSSYFGLSGQASPLQCVAICMDEENCQSFYMEGGTCVFGVLDGVNYEISQAQTVTPDSSQKMHLKSRLFLNRSTT